MTTTMKKLHPTAVFGMQTKDGTNPRRSYSYPIFVRAEPDWEEFLLLLATLQADHFTLIADAGLPPDLVQAVYEHLLATNRLCLLMTLAADELHKTMDVVRSVYTQARSAGGATHASCFVALGGGVIGNIAGLAASLAVRGLTLIHLPTTLLAGTDSILSCKQGVNESIGESLVKNLVGTFYAPTMVLLYTSFWRTLPADEIRSGLCELIKNVVAIAPQWYDEVMEMLNPQAEYTDEDSVQIFQWCFAAKQQVMRNDAHEQGSALILELGHEVAHALEARYGYRHGDAVGLGVLISAHLSHQRGLLSEKELQKHYRLLLRNGIPTSLPASLSVEEIMQGLQNDTKIGYLPRQEGLHTIVLLEHLGQPVLTDGLPLCSVTTREIVQAIKTIQVHETTR
jgi:3-dehydroquinate synthetase